MYREARRALDDLHIVVHSLTTPIRFLSGGQRQSIAIGRAVTFRPQVLILDEPSVGLDPGARRDLWIYLQKLREKDGVTILVTTHLIDEGDRMVGLGLAPDVPRRAQPGRTMQRKPAYPLHEDWYEDVTSGCGAGWQPAADC